MKKAKGEARSRRGGRLARALKENLARRKEQQRKRRTGAALDAPTETGGIPPDERRPR
jgi:hypothetical protein